MGTGLTTALLLSRIGTLQLRFETVQRRQRGKGCSLFRESSFDCFWEVLERSTGVKVVAKIRHTADCSIALDGDISLIGIGLGRSLTCSTLRYTPSPLPPCHPV